MGTAYRRLLGVILGVALGLAGCAGGPPERPLEPVGPPPPPLLRPPQEVVLEKALNEFYGAPYRSGGSTPAGVDCSGLIQGVFQRAGVALPRTVAQQFYEGRPVAVGELHFGDVVFFNRFCQVRSPDYYAAGILAQELAEQVCHNGIYVGQGRFVHASPKGVFVSRLDAEVWRASYMGARRYLPASN